MRSHLVATGALALLVTTQAYAAPNGPIVVSCGPGQHAVVREAFVRGEPVTRVTCAPSGRASEVPVTRRYARPHRSWGKTALIVGGSAGTGAGIGGIVGGKKGALIGAALGGGAAGIYEGAKRR
jgi:hypothetical protein